MIVVAEAGGELGPVVRGAAADALDDVVEADQAGVAFGRQADLGIKMVNEGFLAAAELGGEVGDVDAAGAGGDAGEGVSQLAGGRAGAREAAQEGLLEQVEAGVPILVGVQAIEEFVVVLREEVREPEDAAAEVGHRRVY